MESSSAFVLWKVLHITWLVVLLRAVDIYSDIAFLDCIGHEGGLSHRYVTQDRLLNRQESRRIFELCSKMYSKTLALSQEQQGLRAGGEWMLEGG